MNQISMIWAVVINVSCELFVFIVCSVEVYADLENEFCLITYVPTQLCYDINSCKAAGVPTALPHTSWG